MIQHWAKIFNEKAISLRIEETINKAYSTDDIVYPNKKDCLKLFQIIKPEDIKVVIIGQDPYHNPDQANGIAFSANNNIKTPKSLNNIFKELYEDLQIDHSQTNDLSKWVEQGVFLINTCWTVKENQPASHNRLGWQSIVADILNQLNKQNKNIIYCLWGNYAKSVYDSLEYKTKFKIVSAHPSPLSYSRGFKNSKPFSQINKILIEIQETPIDWNK